MVPASFPSLRATRSPDLYPLKTVTTTFYTGVDDGEHFTEVDKFDHIFEALASYFQLINEGPIDGETIYLEAELGAWVDGEMETIEYHDFSAD